MALDLQKQQPVFPYSQFRPKPSHSSVENEFFESRQKNIFKHDLRRGKPLDVKTPKKNEIMCDNIIPNNHIYALKKRLLAPVWWVEGLILGLGSKEAWFDSLASSRVGKTIASPVDINAKNIILLFSIWHELASKMFLLKNDETNLRIEISKHLSGTQKDIQDLCRKIETIWTTPLKLFEIKPSKRTKSLSLSKHGSLNFVRQAQVCMDADGIWLTLNLSQSFQDFFYPPELLNSSDISGPQLISISPVVIQSMGSKTSIKKLLNYLFLEFAKQEKIRQGWSSFQLDSKSLPSFHKEILSSAPSFYDHGVLGWCNSAPNISVFDLGKQRSEEEHDYGQRGNVVFAWQLSEQAKDARSLEASLGEKMCSLNHKIISLPEGKKITHGPKIEPVLLKSPETLFPEPPPDELKEARERKKSKLNEEKKQARNLKNIKKEVPHSSLVQPKQVTPKKTLKKAQTTLFDSAPAPTLIFSKSPSLDADKKEEKATPEPQIKRSTHDRPLSDNEFMVLVSEFYESLRPTQKRTFEKERTNMTHDQFRAYMAPILKRK